MFKYFWSALTSSPVIPSLRVRVNVGTVEGVIGVVDGVEGVNAVQRLPVSELKRCPAGQVTGSGVCGREPPEEPPPLLEEGSVIVKVVTERGVEAFDAVSVTVIVQSV